MSTKISIWSMNDLALAGASEALGNHRQGRVWGELPRVFLSFSGSSEDVSPFDFGSNVRAGSGGGAKLSRHRNDGS